MATINDDGFLTYYKAVDGSSSLQSGEWNINFSKSHAVRIFSDHDAFNNDKGCIIPERPEPRTILQDSFSDLPNEAFRTEIIPDGLGGEDIALSLDDKIINVLMDQSGSMTWNDDPKLRHTVARRMVERLGATYPGTLNYNVFRYTGTPVETMLFGVIESDEINSDDIQSVASTFFEDDESNFSGVRILRKEGSYSNHPLDGDIVAEGFLNKIADDDLVEGTDYFYTVFSFDKNFHFSKGVQIKAAPRRQVIPRGVLSPVIKTIAGTGVTRDENLIGSWHFGEGLNNRLFDFSDSKANLVFSDDPFWLIGEDIPIGVSGVRFNSVTTGASTEAASSKLVLENSGKLTMLAWVFPYDLSTDRVILSRQSAADTNYLFKHDATGALALSVDGSTFATSSIGLLVESEWNHVAVTVDLATNEVEFLVDGISDGTTTLPSVVTNDTDDMFLDIGFDRLSVSDRFFGKITEVSLHNTIRSLSYIQSNSMEEGFDAETGAGGNGDRLVVLKYDIPQDFNFVGGSVRVVRKLFTEPSWQEDGDIVAETAAAAGEVFITDADDFVLDVPYFYRMFTQNTTGNFSFQTDSPSLRTSIPSAGEIFRLDDLVPPLFSPAALTAQPGNRKVFLSWSNVVLDDRIVMVEVYHNDFAFPVVQSSGKVSGQLVFRGEVDEEEFVHRNIDNGSPAFYSVVTRDRYGRPSAASNATTIPVIDVDEIGIPLLEVENIHFEIINTRSLSILWDNPIEFKANLEAFFDQRILLYASVNDGFGRPVSDDSNITLQIDATLSFLDQADDVFGGDSINTAALTARDFFSFSVTREASGIVKGALTMTDNVDRLSTLSSASFEVKVFSFIPDPQRVGRNIFEFLSTPVKIQMTNPLLMDVENRDRRRIQQDCPVDASTFFSGSSISDLLVGEEEKSYDGAYIRSTNAFVARVNLSFRNEPLLGDSAVSVSVWDATANLCDINEQPPRRKAPSSTVTLPASTLPVQRSTSEDLDSTGNPTGDIREKSFVDIPVSIPDFPQKAILFVQIEYNGYKITKELFIVFQNILVLELNVAAPISNGIEVSEQFANVYLIDPDFPEDEEKRTPVDDFTIVKWEILEKEFGTNRPFYSTDTVSNTGGVYSFVRNGAARKVFFGPAQDVKLNFIDLGDGSSVAVGERYNIAADVVFDGLSAFDDKDLEILPMGGGAIFGTRFLMEMQKFKNVLWADGEDYQRLIISSDPNATSIFSRIDECFRSCILDDGGELVALSAGQGIHITTGDPNVEIVWGTGVVETIDPYSCNPILVLGDNSFSAQGEAIVELEEGLDTFVYFRINDFFPPPPDGCEDKSDDNKLGTQPFLNPCVCLGIKKDQRVDELCVEIPIEGSTTILLNEEPRTVFGGGSIEDGIPPTILVPKEPLEIHIVEKRVNGILSNTFVVDGESINEFIVDVSFADCPVPDGTPIALSFLSDISGGESKLAVEEVIVYTQTRIESTINPLAERSYASIIFEPVSVDDGLNETLVIATDFDKTGTVERLRSVCAKIRWSPSDQVDDELEDVFDNELWAYDTGANSWSELAPMKSPRGYVNFEFVGENGYAIGGIDANTISSAVEKYDTSDDSWSVGASMPIPRFGAMSVEVGGKIYVMGGVTADVTTADLVISLAAESYDTVADEWTVLTNMPTVDDGSVDGVSYGVAFGVAKHVVVSGSSRIYVLSGLTEIDKNGQVELFNDRVIYYDIDNDLWVVLDTLTGVDLAIYQRISPTSFADGSGIVVNGGSIIEGDEKDGELLFVTDSFRYDPSTDVLVANDNEFTIMPRPRHRASSVTIGDSHFIIGGSNGKSQTLNILEEIDASVDPFGFTKQSKMPKGRTAMGAASASPVAAPFSGVPHVFVAGGFISGRPDGFLQILAETDPTEVSLDGRQSASIDIELLDEAGDPPIGEVTVVARGFLNFPGNAEASETQQTNDFQQQSSENLKEKITTYPVLFSTQEVVTSAGKTNITLLPRSDDILEATSEILLRQSENEIESFLGNTATVIQVGEIRNPYIIFVELTIVDDFYFGQTVSNVQGTAEEKNVGLVPVATSNTVEELEEELCDQVVQIDTTVRWEQFSIGVAVDVTGLLQSNPFDEGEDGTKSIFALIPMSLDQTGNPSFGYFSDIGWIPTVDTVLGSNDSSTEAALVALSDMENEIPFGASALFDALIAASNVLSDNDVDGIGKIIYLFTDNESNMSFATKEEAIEEVNSIDGAKEVPVLVGNFSMVDPVTLSAKANASDTNDLDEIAKTTGGQSVTVLSEEFEDDIVQIFVGNSVGSIGYGTFVFTLDIGETVELNKINTLFELFDNTNGTWKIEVSLDGHTFTSIDDIFKANEEVNFTEVLARFIRFTITLTTGFTASNDPAYELIPLPGSPLLKDITIVFDVAKVIDIFFKKQTAITAPQQFALAVNASKVSPADIQVGIAKSESHNWSDFQNPAQPSIDQNGKIFIPIRTRDDEDVVPFETLEKQDGYVFKAKFGRWDTESSVTILDSTDTEVAASEYKMFPRDGLIVFNSRRIEDYKIKIANGDCFRVGIRAISRSNQSPLELCDMGYLYNTNISLLPPIEKLPPEAQNVALLPDEPTIYSVMSASYEFNDANNDIEDTEQTEIRWFVNGVRVGFLDNLVTWNDAADLTDPLYSHAFTFNPSGLSSGQTVLGVARVKGESILKTDDEVFFTVKVSDGVLFGEKIKSNIVQVAESPPVVDSIFIKGLKANGQLSNTIRSDDSAIVQFNFISDVNTNSSEIVWFVNDDEFKRGKLGEVENADRLTPGEFDQAGNPAMLINNEIFAQIIPETDSSTGSLVTSETIIVKNGIPSIENTFLGPSNPKSTQNLVFTYTFVDRDVEVNDPNQSDQSIVQWFFSDSTTGNVFTEVVALQGLLTAAPSFTKKGQQWRVTITPFDSLDQGDPVDSNTVRIR